MKIITMANEYLIKKWKLWFKCMDRQHKGYLTKEDQKKEEEEFVKLHQLEGERKEEVKEVFQNLWDQVIFHGKKGPVTEQEFVDMTNEDFKKGKAEFEETVRKLFLEDLKAVDQTGEGSLTEEMFLKSYKAAGFTNEEWNKKLFQVYSPVNGKAPFDNMIDAWVHFLINEDSSKKDDVLEVLESYPDL